MSYKNVFNIIIVVCIAFYMFANSQNLEFGPASVYGLQRNLVFENGEYYRIFTYFFMHADWMHLFINMLALNVLSSAVVRFIDVKFSLIVYMVAGILGAFIIMFVTDFITVGASGAIYSMFGMIIYFAYKQYRAGYDEVLKSILPILLINLMISFMPGISFEGHLSGFVIGLIGAFIYDKMQRRKMIY